MRHNNKKGKKAEVTSVVYFLFGCVSYVNFDGLDAVSARRRKLFGFVRLLQLLCLLLLLLLLLICCDRDRDRDRIVALYLL